MHRREGNVYCCCQLLLIYHGVYLIAFHCLLQGVSGAGVVLTSTYKPESSVVNYTTIASNLCLIPTGILVFWANVYENSRGAKVASFVITFATIFNLGTALMYFSTYIYFRANSLLDYIFFWRHPRDWIGPGNFPFTLWHISAAFLVLINGLWFYYAIVMYWLSKVFKTKRIIQE